MDNKISILFYSKTARNTKENMTPVYLRITIDGKRIEQSINRPVELAKWSKADGKMKGKTAEAKVFNDYLDTLRNKVYSIERGLMRDRMTVTYETFRDNWFGVNEKSYMLIEVFRQHNNQVKELIGKDFTPATYQRYKTSMMHTQSFLKWKYKAEDIDITKLNYEFINDYSFWLKSKRNCSHNTTMKYLANFKKVVLLCIKNGWLQKDPFFGFKLSKKEVERPFLTSTELQEMITKDFKIERLALVRDIFIFSCYTGLAYADVKKLKRNEIGVGVDGEQWIFTKRKKTDTPTRLPLLPTSLAFVE